MLDLCKYAKSANYISIKCLIRLMLNIPGSNVHAGRVFSCPKKILTSFRTTMGQDRLSSYIPISMSKCVILSTEEVIEKFTEFAPRKLNVVVKK